MLPAPPEPRERPGAWWALAAITLVILLAAGARSSFAPFVIPIEQDLHLDRAVLSVTGFLTLVGYALSQPAAGRLSARFGSRAVMMTSVVCMAVGGVGASLATQAWQLYLFAGLLPGLGFGGASIVPGTALLAKLFTRRLGLATGIMSSAIPGGATIFVPLAALMIPLLGWRATYLYAGLVLAVIALPVLLFTPEPSVNAPRRASDGAPVALPRRPIGRDVWLLGIGFFGCGFTDQFVSFHLVALAQDAGLSAEAGAAALGLLSLVGIIGSVASGPLADRAPPSLMLAGLYFVRAISLPLLLLVGTALSAPALGVFVVVFGATFIANQPPGTRLVRQRYGAQAVGTIIGNVGFAHQIGGAIGIGLGGVSATYLGGYGPAVLTAAWVVLVGSVCQVLIPRVTPAIAAAAS